MISSWLFKVLLFIGLGGFLLIELGSPLVVRVQLDDTATEAAREAADTFKASQDPAQAKQAAVQKAASESATVKEFSIQGERVRVKLEKKAHSYLLGDIKQLEDWYKVTAAGSAASLP